MTILLIALAVAAVVGFIVSGFWVMAWFAVLDLMESIRKRGW